MVLKLTYAISNKVKKTNKKKKNTHTNNLKNRPYWILVSIIGQGFRVQDHYTPTSKWIFS